MGEEINIVDWRTGINDDYAVMRGGHMQFYYGYEETDENENWLFVVTKNGKRKMALTALDLSLDQFDEPVRILLEGISVWLDQEKL